MKQLNKFRCEITGEDVLWIVLICVVIGVTGFLIGMMMGHTSAKTDNVKIWCEKAHNVPENIISCIKRNEKNYE